MESLLEVLDKVWNLVSSIDGGVLAGIAIVAEVIFRAVPSEKPRGILVLVGDLCGKLGAVLVLVDQTIDKVVPQKLAAPSKKK